MKTLDLDIYNKNLEACLKEVNNIGQTIYINLCDGTKEIIPWGTLDWIYTFLLSVMVCVVIYIIIHTFKDL